MQDDGWRKVSDSPARWEHPELGAVQDQPGTPTWRLEAKVCGHTQEAWEARTGRRALEVQAGRCWKCAQK